MTKFGDLAVHAQRCEELAETCTDSAIALKLRALAVEYRDVMKRYPSCGASQSSSADEALLAAAVVSRSNKTNS
jgi:hypothetical protein